MPCASKLSGHPVCTAAAGHQRALVPDYLPNLGEVLEAFRQQYPGIPLELTSLSNDEVPVQLQRGALDAGW